MEKCQQYNFYYRGKGRLKKAALILTKLAPAPSQKEDVLHLSRKSKQMKERANL